MSDVVGEFPYPEAIRRDEDARRPFALPGGGAPEAVVAVRDAEMLAATVRWARTERPGCAARSPASSPWRSSRRSRRWS